MQSVISIIYSVLVPVSEDQPHKLMYNFTYKFLIASLEINVTEIAIVTKTHPYLVFFD